MGLSLNYDSLIAFLLVMVRAVAWLSMVPPFSDRQVIPSTVTMSVAAGFAVLVGPTLPSSSIPTDTAGLVGAIVVQIVTGLALGFVLSLLLNAVTAAGSIIDLSGGLNLPAAVDPLGLDQTPMLGQFYEQVALLLLFVSNGYLMMVNGFMRSFQEPSFTLANSNRLAEVLVLDLSTFFASALEIAAPVLVVLFATQIVLGLLSKAAPQMNVWILGLPIQIFLALSLVALSISVLPTYLTRLVGRGVADMSTLFGGL